MTPESISNNQYRPPRPPVDRIQVISSLLEKVLVNEDDPDAGISFEPCKIDTYTIDVQDPTKREKVFTTYYEITGEQLEDSVKTPETAIAIVNWLKIELQKDLEEHEKAMFATEALLCR